MANMVKVYYAQGHYSKPALEQLPPGCEDEWLVLERMYKQNYFERFSEESRPWYDQNSRALTPKHKALFLTRQGVALGQTGRWSEALSVSLNALDLCTAHGIKERQIYGSLLNNTATLMAEFSSYREALNLAGQAVEVFPSFHHLLTVLEILSKSGKKPTNLLLQHLEQAFIRETGRDSRLHKTHVQAIEQNNLLSGQLRQTLLQSLPPEPIRARAEMAALN